MDKKIAVLCGDEPQLSAALSRLDEFSFSFVSGPDDISADSRCVLISQDYSGGRITEIIRDVQKLPVSVAVASADGSAENQELLLDCGADDVITFPIASRLLEKRLTALAESSVLSVDNLDLEVFERISEADQGRGAFIVEEHDFTNIFRFVSRILERLDKKAQMVIFDFNNPLGQLGATDDVYNFVKIVKACLRRGDISAICGTKVLLLLLGADTADGQQVVKRLTDTFESHYYDAMSTITYEIREINS